MTSAMTEKQRVAVEAMEAAGQQGVSLSEYARVHGLAVRELYAALTALRRKGVLPPSNSGTRSEFVAVRVAPSPQRSDGGVVCRIVHRGVAVECLAWPAPQWLAALSAGSSDAAA